MRSIRDNLVHLYEMHKTTVFIVVVMLSLYYIWLMDYLFIFPKESSSWLWLQLLLFSFTIFNCKRWRLSAFIWLTVSMLLLHANKVKCNLLQFPLTEMDIKILTENPVGFFDAIGIARWSQYSGFLIVLLTVIYGLHKVLLKIFFHDNRIKVFVEFTVLAVIIAFSFKVLTWFYFDYGSYVYEDRQRILDMKSLWSPDGMVSASKQLSAIGFLSYAHAASNQKEFKYSNNLTPTNTFVAKQAIDTVAARYLVPPKVGRQSPNIVFILAESSFNPNVAFRLNKSVSNSLFAATEGSEGGIMHVSAVGGGTWKTEFETVTGVDSRLFGFAGEYTHVSLSPFVKKTFASYLEQKGYATRVFYPVKANFYGAKTAYRNYGFKRFDDALDLKLELDWTKFSDQKLAERIVADMPDNQDKPFFHYILTLEGHSPYICRNFTQTTPFPVELTGDSDFAKNCKLNEFILKMSSTEKGVAKIIDRLRAIEEKSGRPFIAVIFGDHQPIDLVREEFNKNRSTNSQKHTFYKIIKSKSVVLPKLGNEFHATLIPSLVSTAVADSAEQIYLPENFYIYEKCGNLDDITSCPEISILTKAYKQYVSGEW